MKLTNDKCACGGNLIVTNGYAVCESCGECQDQKNYLDKKIDTRNGWFYKQKEQNKVDHQLFKKEEYLKFLYQLKQKFDQNQYQLVFPQDLITQYLTIYNYNHIHFEALYFAIYYYQYLVEYKKNMFKYNIQEFIRIHDNSDLRINPYIAKVHYLNLRKIKEIHNDLLNLKILKTIANQKGICPFCLKTKTKITIDELEYCPRCHLKFNSAITHN